MATDPTPSPATGPTSGSHSTGATPDSRSTSPAGSSRPAGPVPGSQATGPASEAHTTKLPTPSKPKTPPAKPTKTTKPERPRAEQVTRAGVIWVAISAGLLILVLLIIFILQNEERVTVNYLGVAGELSLGMALFIAAVAGGILVAIAGAVRLLQLRKQRRQPNDDSSGPSHPGRKKPFQRS